jgi:hypothetical protein
MPNLPSAVTDSPQQTAALAAAMIMPEILSGS